MRNLGYHLKKHLSDSTALVSFFTPLYAAIETIGAGMSNTVSIGSRVLNAALAYGGLASLTRLRDYSKKKFGITKESKEWLKYIHDMAFSGTFALALRPTIYLLAGETDWKKIAIGTAYSLGLSALLAGPMLKFVDTYRDLTGVEESERTPELIKRQKPSIKKWLAAAFVVGSLAVTGLVYSLNNRIKPEHYQSETKKEQVVEKADREKLNNLEKQVIEIETNPSK